MAVNMNENTPFSLAKKASIWELLNSWIRYLCNCLCWAWNFFLQTILSTVTGSKKAIHTYEPMLENNSKVQLKFITDPHLR